MVQNETVIEDFEVVNSSEEKAKFDPSMISLKNMDRLKVQFCEDLKRLSKDDLKIGNNINLKFNNEKEEVEQTSEEKSRRKKAFFMINKIKSEMGNYQFNAKEITRVTEIILNYPDIIEELINKKINISRHIITLMLTSEIQDAVRILRDFADHKKFKLNYDPDPTHKNTTTACAPKGKNSKNGDSNDKKPDNKKDPKYSKDAKDPKDPKDSKDSKDPKNPKDSKDSKNFGKDNNNKDQKGVIDKKDDKNKEENKPKQGKDVKKETQEKEEEEKAPEGKDENTEIKKVKLKFFLNF